MHTQTAAEIDWLTFGTPAALFSRKNLPYNCGPASVGARNGTAEALRSKSIGAVPPIITANLAKQAFPQNGSFSLPMNGVNGGQATANLLCKSWIGFPWWFFFFSIFPNSKSPMSLCFSA